MTISKVKSRTRQQFICLWKAYQMFLFRNCHTVLARFQCHTSQCTFIYSLTHTHIPVHTSTQSYFLQFTCFALLTFILSKCVCMEINIFSQHTYLHSTLSFFFFLFWNYHNHVCYAKPCGMVSNTVMCIWMYIVFSILFCFRATHMLPCKYRY